MKQRKTESFISKRSKSLNSIHTVQNNDISTPTKSQKNSFVSGNKSNKSDKLKKVDYLKESSRSDRCIRINCGVKQMKSRSNQLSVYSSQKKSVENQSKSRQSRSSNLSQPRISVQNQKSLMNQSLKSVSRLSNHTGCSRATVGQRSQSAVQNMKKHCKNCGRCSKIQQKIIGFKRVIKQHIVQQTKYVPHPMHTFGKASRFTENNKNLPDKKLSFSPFSSKCPTNPSFQLRSFGRDS